MRRVEDLKVWGAARKLDGRVRVALRDGRFRGEGDLVRQIKKASNSVAANIAEGYGRRTADDLRYVFGVAIGSATELQTHFYLAADSGLVSSEVFQEIYDLAELTKRLARTFLIVLARRSSAP